MTVRDGGVEGVLAPLLGPYAGGQLRALIQQSEHLAARTRQDRVPEPPLELLLVRNHVRHTLVRKVTVGCVMDRQSQPHDDLTA